MNVGIDKIGFYTSGYYLPLDLLAEARGIDPDKFHTGLGQSCMSVPPPDEDIVTMAASAADMILSDEDLADIELVLFATESGIDQSKAAGLFVHGLLGLPNRCRVLELKEACYGGTAALRLACPYIAANPSKKVLVLAADVARYELGSPGEPTQGCGAVAMLVTANPRIMTIDDQCGLYAEDVMDFWRPNYRDEAVVDGKYSTRVYLDTAVKTWRQYQATGGRAFDSFARYCYHLPFTNIALKAHQRVMRAAGSECDQELAMARVREGLSYNRKTGNSYCASLWESLCCLLDNAEDDLTDQPIGLFSYGSGCMGEFLSGIMQPGYRKMLQTKQHQQMLDERTSLTMQEYEDIFNLKVPQDGWTYVFAQYRTGPYRFGGVDGHRRRYEKVT